MELTPDKKPDKRPRGRPVTNKIEPIPDTAENIAKAMFRYADRNIKPNKETK